ncbi:cytosine permease [Funiculus sociatus GB2-A5]|uniref:Cytosine permease n=1 Tax=Funiculus sociatus GB2-A5 TaxID=2933946 RepID=A0ABV0JNT3_9CYAN|nr:MULTISPECIES: cytosine permease [unclassified Trichocoleus]MBD1908540.1 cytosine permease [Trichocoleus sp. FACHB-832]MBD2063872.1 cytosine permease [Trichocoleus sp. FACHB-6]
MSTTSEPELVQSQANEDYPLSAVPLEARKSFWSLAPLLMGFTLYSGTLFAGGLVGPAYRFFPDLVGLIIIGNLILGVYAAALSYIAANTGLSTVLMARFSFGSIGSRWVDFILGFTQIGWYAWGSALMAELANKLLGIPTGWNWLIILFFTYFFCSTAYIGYRAMDWLSRIAVPAMLILMFWSLVIALGKAGGYDGLQAIVPSKQLGIGEALTIIVGTFVSGGTQATNWSRFAKNGKTAAISTLAAFFFANGFLIFCGAFGALVYGNEDIVQVMALQGLLFWGLVLLFLNMWTTQDNTIYAFSVAGAHMFRTNKRTAFVLGGATVALVLAWGGIYNMLIPYLILLGTFIPPIGGVVMADYWLRHQGEFPSLEERQPAFNWAGIIAYVLASAIAYIAPGVKPVNGIITAVILYFVLSKIIPQSSSKKAIY